MKKIEKAKKRLKAMKLLPDRPVVVNYSGGKDSSVALDLTVKTVGEVPVVWMDSSITLPGVKDFVTKRCKELGLKLYITDPAKHYYGDFVTTVTRCRYFPVISDTWCTKALKLRPQRAYLKSIYGNARIFKVTGVRMLESTRRQKLYSIRKYVEPDHEHRNSFVVHPIIDWTDEDVLRYTKKFDLPVNPLYKSVGVSDCKWCPYYQVEIYEKILSMDITLLDDIIDLERKIGKPSVTGQIWLGDIKERVLKV